MTLEAEPGSGPRADSLLTVALARRPGRAPVRAVRWLALVGSAATQGLVPSPSLADLVVTRRDTGAEVLRLPAGDPDAAPLLLQHVQTQLRELSVGEFTESWGVDRG
jgi:hypothetical protein